MTQDAGIGGAATHKGIWYQALWCLLQAARAQLEQVVGLDGATANGLRLVLEPLGGDAWLERPGGRRVVQLKTLVHGTWSLKDVIEDVLPDLYRSVEPSATGEVTYEFVTEGGIGRWRQVRRFFELLGRRLPAEASADEFHHAYEQLDDSDPLSFGGSSGEFWQGCRTQRGIFDRIVDHLHATLHAEDDPIEQTRRNTWHLLAHFRFVGDIKEAQVRQDLNAALFSVVNHRDQLESVRDAMVGWLIERSRANDTLVTPGELFAAQGLKNVLPVSRTATLKERCRHQVQRRVGLLGYQPGWDVRQLHDAPDRLAPSDAPFVVISGESGYGKSWRLYAEATVSGASATVLLDSTGDTERDLQRAANEVWRSALGHEPEISLQSVAARRADALGRPLNEPWLLIALDRFAGATQANALLATPVEDWGVRMVVACDPATAEVFEQYRRRHPDRVRVVRLGRFTSSERVEYLRRRLGDQWADLPADVRELVRMPQLAAMYCDLAEEAGGWQPQSEYELIDRYWRRLASAEHADHRRDALRLRRLASTILDDVPYPWDDEQLESAQVDEPATRRITNAGWLRPDPEGRYEVPHDRLLNFAVAQDLAVRHKHGRMDDDALVSLFDRMLRGGARFSGAWLAYVPMDWFFLRSDDGAALRVLATLRDRLDHIVRESLHRHLLPTLGAASLPMLWDSLVALADKGQWWELEPVLDGLARRPTREVRQRLLGLLDQDEPLLQRAAMKLLARKPIAEALDRAWQLHTRMQAEPHRFLGDDVPREDARAYELYGDAFDALRECTRLAPEWLADAIRRADPSGEPVHDLAYLTANLDDGGKIWQSCKAELFEQVARDKRRSLAMNVGIWCDTSKLDWLERSVAVADDLLGPAAIRALAQVDPPRAVTSLRKLSDWLLYLCRGWFLPRLFLVAPHETRDQLYRHIRDAADPLRAAQVYQGNENEMDVQTLDLLLDALDEALGRLIEAAVEVDGAVSRARDGSTALYTSLKLLVAVGRIDLLDTFKARGGSRLERRLADLLINVVGPRQTLGTDKLAREPAIALLRKIGGDGHRRVVNAFLDAGNRYGKLDTITEAVSCSDAETISKLRQITVSEELRDDYPLLQTQAVKVLAALGDGRGLVRAAFRLGLRLPADIDEWLRPDIEVDAEATEEAMEVVRRRDAAQLPGALDILGVLRHAPAMDDMMEILRDPPSEDAQLAAIVGLGRLGGIAKKAVELIRPHLTVKRRRHATIAALSRVGTENARRKLLESLGEWWDTRLAVRLARFPETRTEAIEKLVDRLQSDDRSNPGERSPDAGIILAEATDDVLAEVLLRCSAASDHVRDAAFAAEGGGWIVGSRADAIRGLGTFDPHAAQVAATKALRDLDARDRHLYPALLHRLNAQAARDTFLDLAAAEHNAAVTWAMAHSLGVGASAWLLGHLGARSATIRLAACRLASGGGPSDEAVRNRLVESLDDPAHRVATAAEDALTSCRRQQQAEELVKQLELLSSGGSRAWSIMDAALAVGDPGYEGTPWPEWVRLFGESSAVQTQPALRTVFLQRVNKMRKDALAEADRKARQSR